jgi:D-glycero-D-manno-heptose 1,7-bisphosphate phosphatase
MRTIFLDRDGVINRDSPHYIKSWGEFEFFPRSLEALRLLKTNGFDVIVITNQSAVGRGLLTNDRLLSIHKRMVEAVESNGGKIKDVFFCPHIPKDNCECRKPKPGLIHQAEQKYKIDLDKSVMIGDKMSDIICGINAGCGRVILVDEKKDFLDAVKEII